MFKKYLVMGLSPAMLGNLRYGFPSFLKNTTTWVGLGETSREGNRVRFKVVKKVIYNKQKNPHIDGNVLSPIYYKLINKYTTKVLEIKNEPYKLTVYDPTIHVPLFKYNKSLKTIEDETWEVIHVNLSLLK